MSKEFISAVSESYKAFLNPATEYGERSNKKIIPIHSFVATEIAKKLGDEFIISSLGYGDGKEKKIEGFYYNKNVDICISYKGQNLTGISIKFITGNYKQNSNNFFEGLLGETSNLKRNNFKYANFIIIPKYIPYYKKSQRK